MTPGPDERRVIERSRLGIAERIRAGVMASAAFGVPTTRRVKRRARRGYHVCPQCGNPTRGTESATDARCAKCQKAGAHG